MHATIHFSQIVGQQGREHRSHARSDVALPILIALGWTRYSATLHNLSTSGAMIETSAPLAVSSEIEFHCGSICARASVMWQVGSVFGIKFGRRITRLQVSDQVLRSAALAGRRQGRAIIPEKHVPTSSW